MADGDGLIGSCFAPQAAPHGGVGVTAAAILSTHPPQSVRTTLVLRRSASAPPPPSLQSALPTGPTHFTDFGPTARTLARRLLHLRTGPSPQGFAGICTPTRGSPSPVPPHLPPPPGGIGMAVHRRRRGGGGIPPPPRPEALCQPPPPPGPPSKTKVTIVGEKRNLPLGKSCQAIFGAQTFESQNSPPPLSVCYYIPAPPPNPLSSRSAEQHDSGNISQRQFKFVVGPAPIGETCFAINIDPRSFLSQLSMSVSIG